MFRVVMAGTPATAVLVEAFRTPRMLTLSWKKPLSVEEVSRVAGVDTASLQR